MNSLPQHSVGRLTIATRRSRLALWQAEHVQQRLRQLYPQLAVALLPLSTRGDELLKVSLARAGGKGLFIRELEAALESGAAELAVHSMKDVPAKLPAGFALAAIMAREDPRDVFVSTRYAALAELPPGARVGTSSLRRAAQIAERYPGLEIRPSRGNVETRLAKLDRGEYQALVLAAAGLQRLGLHQRVRAFLEIEESLPAPGQGALGIECRASRQEIAALLAPLQDAATAACVRAERAVSAALGGSCTVPLGAYASVEEGRLHLRALVAAPDARRVARAEASGATAEPEALGQRVAALLRERGADEILAALDDDR